jgi:uncharacterized protein (TIGR02145 family)
MYVVLTAIKIILSVRTIIAAVLCGLFVVACSRDNPVNDVPTITPDLLTDSRDGKTYKTITIGSQTWMAENLNIGARINGSANQTNNGIVEKYAYNDNDSNVNIYGALYQWDEAMGYDTIPSAQGICPSGWHLPTDAEWKTLEMALGMTQSGADSTEWRGTDQGTKLKEGGSSGFQALLSGYRGGDGSFYDLGSYADFWSSSQCGASTAWRRYLASGDAGVNRGSNRKVLGFCVRCVKD